MYTYVISMNVCSIKLRKIILYDNCITMVTIKVIMITVFQSNYIRGTNVSLTHGPQFEYTCKMGRAKGKCVFRHLQSLRENDDSSQCVQLHAIVRNLGLGLLLFHYPSSEKQSP